MKKVVKYLVLILVLSFSFIINANAAVLTQEQAKQRVIDSEAKARDLISILTSWSNTYGSDLQDIISRNLINKVNSIGSEATLNLIVSELNSKGHTAAASALNAKKSAIMSDINYLEETQSLLKEYFNANVSGGVVGSRSLFVQIEDSLKALKTPIKNLLNIYYNSFSDKILAEVDSCSSVADVRSIYNDILNKLSELDAEIAVIKNGFVDWQNLYNQYGLEDYEDYIKEEFGTYYNKLDSLYKKVYNELETKMQGFLDQKIQKIISDTHTETDRTNAANVKERNDRLWDIIDYINDFKSDVKAKFNKINSYIKINTAKTYANKYQKQITDRIDEAVEYTKTYLIDNLEITPKTEADKKFVKVQMDNGLIIYDNKDLSATTFIAKLKATYGDLKATKTYSGNVGTLSEVEATYRNNVLKKLLVVVKGDVAPTGKLDITDVVNVCDKMFGKKSLSKYQTIAADMDYNDKIDITDVVMICDRMFS